MNIIGNSGLYPSLPDPLDYQNQYYNPSAPPLEDENSSSDDQPSAPPLESEPSSFYKDWKDTFCSSSYQNAQTLKSYANSAKLTVEDAVEKLQDEKTNFIDKALMISCFACTLFISLSIGVVEGAIMTFIAFAIAHKSPNYAEVCSDVSHTFSTGLSEINSLWDSKEMGVSEKALIGLAAYLILPFNFIIRATLAAGAGYALHKLCEGASE